MAMGQGPWDCGYGAGAVGIRLWVMAHKTMTLGSWEYGYGDGWSQGHGNEVGAMSIQVWGDVGTWNRAMGRGVVSRGPSL